IGHSKDFDFKKELYLPIRQSPFNKNNEIVLPHENSEELFNSKDFLQNCDLMIAEVSFSGTSLGIEIGWANAFSCPVVCIYRAGIKPSSGLKAVSDTFIEYSSPEDLIEKLEKIIK
ncbi:MAG: hypothetical protein AAB842_00515, partial [Patescibacteria group bacterium]